MIYLLINQYFSSFQVMAHDFNVDGDKEPLVHLLYRPGHYDILYK